MITKVQRKYLEINALNDINVSDKPNPSCKIEARIPPDFQINKFFYKQIGKNYRWIDRLVWNDLRWINYTNNKNLETYVLSDNSNLIGFFELLFHPDEKNVRLLISVF